MSFLELIGNDFTFTGADGNDYKLVPLSLTDWGDFVTWVKYKPYRDAIIAGFPDEEIEAIKRQCATGKVIEIVKGEEKEFQINLASTVVRDALATLEGVGKLVELSFYKAQPTFRGKPLGHILTLDVISNIQTEVLKQNGLIDDDEKTEGSSPEGADAKKKNMNT